jgi:hypothetical protein
MVTTQPGTVEIPPGGTVFVASLNVIVSSLNSTDPLADAIAFHEQGVCGVVQCGVMFWNDLAGEVLSYAVGFCGSLLLC